MDVFADGVVTSDSAYVKINWWPLQDGDQPWFQIHYIESDGFNCGWHRQPNDHVDGLDHFQKQLPNEETQYEEVEFEFENPVGILWEVVDDRLVERVQERYQS